MKRRLVFELPRWWRFDRAARCGVGRWHRWAVGCLLLLAAGCSNRPVRIPVPDWDSESTAEAAIELFDTNGDTGIDLREANAAPGLAASIARIDVDSNKERTQEAIRNRLAWHERRGDGLRGESYAILVSGRPLNGAPVDGVSAVILGDVIDGDCAINDEYGNMAPSTEGESVPGLRLQFYCLEVDSDGVAATNRLSLT